MTVERFTEDQVQRYARHIILPSIGGAGQRKLLDASVLVIGAGGLGSPIAMYLAAAGVGKLGIVDFDAVEIDDPQLADAGGGQVHRDRRSEPACADHEHARIQQLALPSSPDVRQDDVAGVPLNLLLGERSVLGRRDHAIVSSSSVTSPSTMKNDRITGADRSCSETRM